MGRPDKYILNDDDEPVPCDDLFIWAAWFEEASRTRRRIVQQDYVEGVTREEGGHGSVGVSTVFLGLDHNHLGVGPPLLYETLVFGTRLDGEMWRASTREEALRYHHLALERVRAVYDNEEDNHDRRGLGLTRRDRQRHQRRRTCAAPPDRQLLA